jgi:hypothetical protein
VGLSEKFNFAREILTTENKLHLRFKKRVVLNKTISIKPGCPLWADSRVPLKSLAKA